MVHKLWTACIWPRTVHFRLDQIISPDYNSKFSVARQELIEEDENEVPTGPSPNQTKPKKSKKKGKKGKKGKKARQGWFWPWPNLTNPKPNDEEEFTKT